MAIPRLTRKDTGKVLSDVGVPGSWSGWNAAGGLVFITPLSGGSGYPQKTGARTLRSSITFRFRSASPNSTIDNYYEILKLIEDQAKTPAAALFRFRDLEGFVQDVQVDGYPGGGNSSEVQPFAAEKSVLKSVYEVQFNLVVPGYLA